MLPQKEKNRHGERLQAQFVLAPSMMLRAPWMMLRAPWVVPNVITPGQPCCRMMHLSMPQMLAAGQPVFEDHHWNSQFCDVDSFDNSGRMAVAHQQIVSDSSNSRSTISDVTESCSSPLFEESDSDDAVRKFQKSAQMHGIVISKSRAGHKSSKTCSAPSDSSLNSTSLEFQPQIVNFETPDLSCTHDAGIVYKRKTSEKTTREENFSGQPGIRSPEEMKSSFDDQEQAVVPCEKVEFADEAEFDFSYDNFYIEDEATEFFQNTEDCEYCSCDSVETEPLQVADSWTQTDVNDRNTEIPIKCHMSVSTGDLIIMVDASTSMEPANISGDYGTATIGSQSIGKQCLSSNSSYSYYSLDQSFTSTVENAEKSLPEVEAVCSSNDVNCRNPTTEKAEESVNGVLETGSRSDSEPTMIIRTKSSLSVDNSSSRLSSCDLSDVLCHTDSATNMEDVTEVKCLSAEQAVGSSCPDDVAQPHGNYGNVENGSADSITMDIVKRHLLAYNPALANNLMILEALATEQMTLLLQQRLQIMFAGLVKQRLPILPHEKPNDALFQSQPHQLTSQMLFHQQQQQQPFAQLPTMMASDHTLPCQEGLLFPHNLSQLSTAEMSHNQSPSVPSESQSSTSSFTMIGKDTKSGESKAHQVSDMQQRFNDLNFPSAVKNSFPKNIPVEDSDHCRNLSQLSLNDQHAMLHNYAMPSYFSMDHGDGNVSLTNVNESPQSKQSKRSIGKPLGQCRSSVSSSSELGGMILSEELTTSLNSEETTQLPKLKATIQYHNEMDVMSPERKVKLSANAYLNQRPAVIPSDKGGSDMMFGESTSVVRENDIRKSHEDKHHDYLQFCRAGKDSSSVNVMTSPSSKTVTKGLSLTNQEEDTSCSSFAVAERSQKLHSQPTTKLAAAACDSSEFVVYRKAEIGRGQRLKEQSMNCPGVRDFLSRASSSSFQRPDSVMAGYENMMASGEVQGCGIRNGPESDDCCRGTWQQQQHSASVKNFVSGDSSESKRCFATEKGSYADSWSSATRSYQHGTAKRQEGYLVEASNASVSCWVKDPSRTVSGWVKDPSHYSSKKTDNASKRIRPKGSFCTRSDENACSTEDDSYW